MSTALEGNVNIRAKNVTAQLIHSNAATISVVDDVHIKAVYSKMLTLSSTTGDIRVDMLQGDAKVRECL